MIRIVKKSKLPPHHHQAFFSRRVRWKSARHSDCQDVAPSPPSFLEENTREKCPTTRNVDEAIIKHHESAGDTMPVRQQLVADGGGEPKQNILSETMAYYEEVVSFHSKSISRFPFLIQYHTITLYN
jgi:hypothetical protein